MKLVATHYRWLPSTFFKNIRGWYWDINTGVRNLFRFFEPVWWHRSFDYSGLLHLMEVSTRRMRVCQQKGHHTLAPKLAKQLTVTAELCRRLREDNYFEMAGYNDSWNIVSDARRRQISLHSDYLAKQDAEYLGKMLKYVQWWWD